MDIFQAIQNNNIQFVQHFLLQNSDINAEYSTTLIHFACSCRPLSLDILKILIESGADLSRTDQRTPLHYLCSKKPDKQSLLYLLNAGSNVQVNRKDGNTPFHLACQSSCGEDILIILIQFGADNSIQNNQVPTDLTSQKNQQKIQKHFEKIQKGAISIEMISFNSVILKLQRGVNINYGILVIKDYENKQQFEEEFHVKNLQEFVKFEGLIPERKYYVYLNKSQKPIVSFKTKKIPTYQFIIQYIGFDSFCCVFLSKIYDPNDTEITTEIAPDHFYSKKMITYEKKRVTIRYENLNVGNLYELKFKILYRKFTHEIQGKETIKLQNADFEIFNTFSRKMNLFQDILEANYWNEEKILEVEKYFQQYQELEKKSKMDDLISLILSQDSISKISEKLDLWMSFYNAKQILVENMKEIVYPKNENDMNINKKGIFSQEMENYLFIKNFFEKFPKSQPNLEEEKENITGNDLNIKKSQNKMIEINSSKYNSIFDGWEKSISKVAIERMKIMEDRKKWTNLIETVNNQEKSKETILQNFQQCQFLVKNQQEFAAIDINIFLKYPKLKDLEFFEVVKMETQIKKQLFKFDSLLSKLKYLSEKIRKEIIKTCRRFLESPNKGNLTMNFGRNLNQNINLNVNLNLEQNSNQNSNQIVPLKERKKINFNIDFSSEDENDFKNICDSSDDYDVDENDDVEFDSTIESDSSDIDSYSSSGKIMSENELNMLISQREDLREKLGLFATQLKQDLKTVHSKMIKFSKELANGQNQEIVGISAPKPIITRPKNDILMKKMSENEIISEWGILTNLFTQIDKNITQTFNLIKNTFIHPSQNKIQEITTKNVEIQQLAKNCLSFQKEKKEILNQIFILYLKKQREFSQSVENIKKQMEKYESKFEEILLIIEKKKQKNNLQEMKQKIETEIGKYQKMMEKYQEEKKEAQFQEMKIEKIKLEKDKDQAEQKIQEICYNFYPEEAFHSFSPSVLIDLPLIAKHKFYLENKNERFHILKAPSHFENGEFPLKMYQLKQQNELSPKENGLVPPSRSISLEDFTNISEDVELSFEIDISQKKIFRPKTQSNEKNRKNQDVFAIKSIPIMGYQQFFKNLIPILRLRHPGIIQCELITIKEGQVHLHFPFYSKGNIRQFTEKGTNLKEIFFIIGHVLITLNYIHSQGIYHSNLKPENILITDNLTPVLSDFGNSQNANWKQIFERFPRQNLNLIPPEIFQQKSKVKYDSKADMYSLGVTMKELSKINSDFEKDQNYLEIMESFMEINPDKRPSALQILKTYLDIWGIQMDLQNLISFHNPSHDVFKLYPKKVLSENKLKKSRLEDERKKN